MVSKTVTPLYYSVEDPRLHQETSMGRVLGGYILMSGGSQGLGTFCRSRAGGLGTGCPHRLSGDHKYQLRGAGKGSGCPLCWEV